LPPESGAAPEPVSQFAPEFKELPRRGLRWIFIGPSGLRAGWSVAVFRAVWFLIIVIVGGASFWLHLIEEKPKFTASASFFQELVVVIGMLAGAAAVALLEGRKILDFNLRGPRRIRHFFSGLVAGFVALSLLVCTLWLGGWVSFGPVALSGAAVFRFGAMWGCAFLLVGCYEEGTFRCYLQFTLTRSLNFWWALAVVAAICAWPAITGKGNGIWGVFVIALLGLAPCLWLHLKRAPGNGFWQAAWVTSTLFGLFHTGNGGENWVGVFHAAAIGFVFCVSVRVTGSAWWAIGCHAAWDWSETYFYGSTDSGLVASGHFLSTTPAGNVLWSGGAAGPEGSALAMIVILLLLVFLVAAYGRRQPMAEPAPMQAVS
jgi:membrane protease YdiL (CAAX protease family)